MENEVEVFDFHDTTIRTVLVDGEPWFVLKDVCTVLGITSSRDAASRLNQDGVGLTDVIDRLGRSQRTYVISESNLYRIVLRSDKPEADPFIDWVTKDVLPQLRQTGRYTVPTLPLSAVDTRMKEVEVRALALRVAKEIGVVPDFVLDSYARDMLAIGSNKETVLDEGTRMLTVSDFLQSKGLSREAIRRQAPAFGKRLKAKYINSTGVEPGSVTRYVEGVDRAVAAYPEACADIFEDVWAQSHMRI